MKRSLFNTYYLTEESLGAVKQKLVDLKNELSVVSKEMHEVRRHLNQTDAAENVSYTDFIVRRQMIEAELVKNKRILDNAKVIKRKRFDRVAVGCRVYLSDGAKKLRYTIVNSFEADPLEGKISDESPLGKALLGRKLHEVIAWSFGHQKTQLTLMKIE